MKLIERLKKAIGEGLERFQRKPAIETATESYAEKIRRKKLEDDARQKEWDKKRREKDLFEIWKRRAQSTLVNILRDDKFDLRGLEYQTNEPGCSFAYTSGTNLNKIVAKKDENYVIEMRDSDYTDNPHNKTIEPEDLASAIIYGTKEMYGDNPIHPRINSLVRQIKEKTGIDLNIPLS